MRETSAFTAKVPRIPCTTCGHATGDHARNWYKRPTQKSGCQVLGCDCRNYQRAEAAS